MSCVTWYKMPVHQVKQINLPAATCSTALDTCSIWTSALLAAIYVNVLFIIVLAIL